MELYMYRFGKANFLSAYRERPNDIYNDANKLDTTTIVASSTS